jgi:hypothetical protein
MAHGPPWDWIRASGSRHQRLMAFNVITNTVRVYRNRKCESCCSQEASSFTSSMRNDCSLYMVGSGTQVSRKKAKVFWSVWSLQFLYPFFLWTGIFENILIYKTLATEIGHLAEVEKSHVIVPDSHDITDDFFIIRNQFKNWKEEVN